MRWMVLGILMIGVFVGGCAETTFRVVESSDPAVKLKLDSETNGIRYYAPTTYVLVKPDYKGRKAEVVVFNAPDTTTTYAAAPRAWLASHNTELTFENGMLTKVLSNPNNTKVAVDTVKALSAIASRGLEAAAAAAKAASTRARPPDETPPIFLYRLESNGTLSPVSLTWKQAP